MKKLLCVLAILAIAVPSFAATVTWTHDGLNTTGYTVWFYKTSTPTDVYNKSVTGSTVRSMVLDDNYFQPGISYTFYMTAYNAVDKSANSATTTWTRPGGYTAPADKLPTSMYMKPNGIDTLVIDLTP